MSNRKRGIFDMIQAHNGIHAIFWLSCMMDCLQKYNLWNGPFWSLLVRRSSESNPDNYLDITKAIFHGSYEMLLYI